MAGGSTRGCCVVTTVSARSWIAPGGFLGRATLITMLGLLRKVLTLMADMRPRLLDLFCGAGGAAMGYHRAGLDVVGVDIKPQPNYPFRFVQGDALGMLSAARWPWYAAIHASPPCQHYAAVTEWRGNKDFHQDLVGQTRELLQASGLPWVIENVREAPITGHLMLCGSQFGLPIRRHRHFETSWNGWTMTQPCQHRATDLAFMHKGERAYADAMGCTWMTAREAREAIPPAYTEFIGVELLRQLASPSLASPILEA